MGKNWLKNGAIAVCAAILILDSFRIKRMEEELAALRSGYNGMGEKEEDFLRQAALLLIKGRNEQHDTMQISEAPISYEDLQEAYVRLLDGAQSDAVFDWKEGDTRERRFLEYAPGNEKHMVEYLQKGHAQDLTTMVPTGRVFDR